MVGAGANLPWDQDISGSCYEAEIQHHVDTIFFYRRNAVHTRNDPDLVWLQLSHLKIIPLGSACFFQSISAFIHHKWSQYIYIYIYHHYFKWLFIFFGSIHRSNCLHGLHGNDHHVSKPSGCARERDAPEREILFLVASQAWAELPSEAILLTTGGYPGSVTSKWP